MPLCQSRMLEILSRIVRHPQLLHHPPRADVCLCGERHYACQPKLLESVAHHLPRPFGSQPLTPMRTRKPSPNLNRRHKRRIERRYRKPDKPKKPPVSAQLRRKRAKAVPLEMPLGTVHHRI